jgi:hypothetical protein
MKYTGGINPLLQRKPEHPEKTTDLSQVTDSDYKLGYIHIQERGRRGLDGMVVGSTTICDKVCQ